MKRRWPPSRITPSPTSTRGKTQPTRKTKLAKRLRPPSRSTKTLCGKSSFTFKKDNRQQLTSWHGGLPRRALIAVLLILRHARLCHKDLLRRIDLRPRNAKFQLHSL